VGQLRENDSWSEQQQRHVIQELGRRLRSLFRQLSSEMPDRFRELLDRLRDKERA
jgi:hypothetical protein